MIEQMEEIGNVLLKIEQRLYPDEEVLGEDTDCTDVYELAGHLIKWNKTVNEVPQGCNFPVIGFSEKWKDPDWNPRGLRECFPSGSGWCSAKWNGDSNYNTDNETAPTHWMSIIENFEN